MLMVASRRLRRVRIGALALAAVAPCAPAYAADIVYTSNACIDEPMLCPASARGFSAFSVGADGTGRRFLAQAVDARWMPGGRRVVAAVRFVSDVPRAFGSALWTMNPQGGDLQRITDDAGHDREPSFSRDGRRVTFSSSRASRREFIHDIYVANADGSAIRRLTTDPGHEDQPHFSPDGREILFVRSPGSEDDRLRNPPDPVDLWSVPADGGQARPLTVGGGIFGSTPVVSPDTTEAVFAVNGRIWILDLLNGSVRAIGERPDGVFDTSPDWSADGRQVVFARTLLGGLDEVGTELVIASAAGGPGRVVYREPGASRQIKTPSWHGQGMRLGAGAGAAADDSPPLTLIGPTIASAVRVEAGRARASAAASRVVRTTAAKLNFLTLDRSGVRRVEMALRPRSSRRPLRWRTVTTSRTLRARATALGPGTYELRVRATDRLGNTTRVSRPVMLRLQ